MGKLRPTTATEDDPSVTPIPELLAQSEMEQGTTTWTVLHVDDDPAFLELSEEFLTRLQEDFTVVTESTACAGLERLANGEIHAVISDYEMPRMNGLEFLETVRADHPDLPFILFTCKGSEEIATEAIASGVTDYLQKGAGADQYEVLANRTVNALEQYFTMQDLWTTLRSFSRLVDQDLVGIFVLQNGMFRYVNRRFAQVFESTQHALIGESIERVVAPADIDTVGETVRELEDGGPDSVGFSFSGLSDNGNPREITAEAGVIDLQGKSAIIGSVLPSNCPGAPLR